MSELEQQLSEALSQLDPIGAEEWEQLSEDMLMDKE